MLPLDSLTLPSGFVEGHKVLAFKAGVLRRRAVASNITEINWILVLAPRHAPSLVSVRSTSIAGLTRLLAEDVELDEAAVDWVRILDAGGPDNSFFDGNSVVDLAAEAEIDSLPCRNLAVNDALVAVWNLLTAAPGGQVYLGLVARCAFSVLLVEC